MNNDRLIFKLRILFVFLIKISLNESFIFSIYTPLFSPTERIKLIFVSFLKLLLVADSDKMWLSRRMISFYFI